MSLSDLASLGSFISGVAVLVSLVFLYRQLRQIGAQIEQAEKNQRASIRASRASRTVENLAAFVEPSAADAVGKGLAGDEDMTPTQIRQFSAYCLGRFYNIEEAYSQHAVGLLDAATFANMLATLKGALASPGIRAGWRVVARNQFDASGDFVAFIDSLLAETSATRRDPVARWREAFAAEKAAPANG